MKKTSKRTGASRRPSPVRRRAGKAAPAPLAALAAFDDLARREHLRWYVFGAQAVAAYGVPRFTADLDLTVDLGDRSLADFRATLRRAKFEPRFDDDAFAAETRVFPVTHKPTAWSLDLVLAGPGLEQVFLDEARMLPMGRRQIPVIAPDHLVAIKILAGRPKDLEDVRGLIRIAKLDDARIVATLRELEALLDHSDLQAVYEQLRKEAQR